MVLDSTNIETNPDPGTSFHGRGLSPWPADEAHAQAIGYGPATYGPDVELEHIFAFMQEQRAADRPFFIYHTSHLGHDHFDFLDPDAPSKWPGTPVIEWDGERYTHTEPRVTRNPDGSYDTHGTVTPPGMHHHVNYLDYQVEQYLAEFERLGIADNTILIFCADNGTSGYGKHNPDRQKGTHIPFIIYAGESVGMVRRGAQDVLTDLSDILPTIAELAGIPLPAGYELHGESLMPWLRGEQETHRDWIYAYRGPMQLVRGPHLLRDGYGRWWDAAEVPDDLISYPELASESDWSSRSAAYTEERTQLESVLERFNTHPEALRGAE